MRDQLVVAGARDTWRHTADLLFLLERPVLREAFFPSGATLPVERARPADRDPILDIARIHDGDSGAAIMSEWWKQAAHMFSVVRGSAGEVVGFYVMARPQDIPRSLAECDPLLAVWLSYVQARGSDPRRPYLLIRCLLSRADGRTPKSGVGGLRFGCQASVSGESASSGGVYGDPGTCVGSTGCDRPRV